MVPEHIQTLTEAGFEVWIQPSNQRVFSEDTLQAAGAKISEDLNPCPVILGVKEIPLEQFRKQTTYLFFSHTVKGQSYNMPMLARMLELGCTLIDYERIVDEEGRRLVSFSRFAGMAGLVDTLWVYGQRKTAIGKNSAFRNLKQALCYPSIFAIQESLYEVGKHCRASGERLRIAIAGMGRVSRGALEMTRYLAPSLISPADLSKEEEAGVQLCLFDVADLIRRKDGRHVDTQEYRLHPERYRNIFADFAPHFDILVNGIYWEPKYPRLLTKADVKRFWEEQEQPRLQVIGDVSCDIDGSIEMTVKPGTPGSPSYVYLPQTDSVVDGVEGQGPVIMATDILPTELPREASNAFSEALVDLVPGLVTFATHGTGLPPELGRATIVSGGALTEDYRYLENYLETTP